MLNLNNYSKTEGDKAMSNKEKYTGRGWFAFMHSNVEMYWDMTNKQKASFIDYIFEVQMYGRDPYNYPEGDPLVRIASKAAAFHLKTSLKKYDDGLENGKRSGMNSSERDKVNSADRIRIIKDFTLGNLSELKVDKLYKKLIECGKGEDFDNLEVYLKRFRLYMEHKKPTWTCSEKGINAIFETTLRTDEFGIKNMEELK